MANHFRLVVESPEANLVSGLAWLLRPLRFALRAREAGNGGRVAAGDKGAGEVEGGPSAFASILEGVTKVLVTDLY